MTRRWAGALGAALLLAGGGARAAERPKILVLPVSGKAADAGFRQRVGEALSEGLIASGGEVVAPPSAPPHCRQTAAPHRRAWRPRRARRARRSFCAHRCRRKGVATRSSSRCSTGSPALELAQRENRCEICTDAEALEIANAAASALKAQAMKKAARRRRPRPASRRRRRHPAAPSAHRPGRARDRARPAGTARQPG